MLNSNSYTDYSWREVRYHSFYQVVDTVVKDIQNHIWVATGTAKKRLKGARLEMLAYSVEKLMRDSLAVVMDKGKIPNCPIAKSKMRYGSDREDAMLTYEIFIGRAYKGMIELGYLYEAEAGFNDRHPDKGKFSKSRFTRFRAEDKLINLFSLQEQRAFPVIIPPKTNDSIIVQEKIRTNHGGTKKHRTKFLETTYTTQLRTNIEIINQALSRHWYDLEIENEQFKVLQNLLSTTEVKEQGKEYVLDLSQRTLFRIFNDNNFETGGRFYGGWWQNIPKKYRSNIIIDGKQTVEFDYSSIHPTILYLREGLVAPNDAYTQIIDDCFDVAINNRNELRSMLKGAFNAMLNAKKTMKNAPNGIYPDRFGLNWRQVSDAIQKSHASIAHHFYSDMGRRLQKVDSDIAELVMLHFADRNIPILPIHDSFIMHHRFDIELSEMMKKAFERIVGGPVGVEQKLIERLPSLPAKDYSENDIQDVIDLVRQSYMRRETTFFNMR